MATKKKQTPIPGPVQRDDPAAPMIPYPADIPDVDFDLDMETRSLRVIVSLEIKDDSE